MLLALFLLAPKTTFFFVEKKKEDGSIFWIIEGCECVSETVLRSLG